MAFGNASYDQILSSTLANHEKSFADNVFKRYVLLWLLSEKNKVKKKGGGHKIVRPLMGDDGHAASYGEFEVVTITPQTGITSAEYAWKFLEADVIISGKQELTNMGSEEVFDLLEAKVFQAEKTLSKNLNTMLYSDGTGNSGKDFGGLALYVDSTGTVGGIDSSDSDNAWWRSTETDYTAVADIDLRAAFTHNIHLASDGGTDKTDAIITDLTTYEAFESQLVPSVRYSEKNSVNAGFSNLLVQDTPVYWDNACPAQTAFGLNTDYIELVGHKDRWFKHTKFTEGLDAPSGGNGTWMDARMALILCMGNLTMNNRSRQFKMTTIADPA